MLLCRPVILDPTDPTRNVAGGNPLGWWLLAGEAKAWLEYPCVRNCEKSPVRSWPVLVRPYPHPVPLLTALVTPSVWRLFLQRCGLLLKLSTVLGSPAAPLVLQTS